ncbi:bifunctional 4-hydroxy-2-oxoglutarate aldolase/2-dehydro-3-deoxy-phosphogluconate aldolase [uncultured Jatrophihabitans sp.]|uniref:bifunctional 4-hydroxy-2-oxoglutarate aldolase/2-dehydro-3-deoxy-phosphogluconate aldolase n=1 Tax=uncultured Jatrophihabitans sp. TaxID=1610747 RepID=UPI0035CC4785
MTGAAVAATGAVDRLGECGVVPVLAVDDPAHGGPLAQALAAGGLPVAEVTFRTPAAAQVLGEMAAVDGMLVGAGTVLTAGQVDTAVDAGARFVVSPGWSDAVVRRCAELDVPVLPGVATATDVLRALDHGVRTVKFFPAETSGGVAAVKALAAPFAGMRFVPTGGIGEQQLSEYLAVPNVLAVGGSWLAPPALVAAGNWAEITRLARAAVDAVGPVRDARP